MRPTKHTAEILAAAIQGFEVQKQRIDAQITEIRRMLDGSRTVSAALSETARPKRKVSPAARRKIAEAQRKRWAAIRQRSEPQPVASEASNPKRELSAAGRKRIIEATKKRWAAFRAAKKAGKPAVAKAKRATASKAASKKVAKA